MKSTKKVSKTLGKKKSESQERTKIKMDFKRSNKSEFKKENVQQGSKLLRSWKLAIRPRKEVGSVTQIIMLIFQSKRPLDLQRKVKRTTNTSRSMCGIKKQVKNMETCKIKGILQSF